MDEQQSGPAARARRPSGRDAKIAARTARSHAFVPYITRNIPYYEVLSTGGLELLENNADTILEEIGIDFRDDAESLKLCKDAGADVQGERVRFPRGMCRSIVRRSAPKEFTQYARNPARNVVIGGNRTVFAPAYGSPFVRSLDEGRRYARIEDFRNFVKLAYMATSLHHSGGTVCEPVDLPVNKRHFDMVYAHMKYSDKPYMGSVTHPSRALDTIEMTKILFGDQYTDPETGKPRTCIVSLINANSPLTWDATMLGALKAYGRADFRNARAGAGAVRHGGARAASRRSVPLGRRTVRVQDLGCPGGLRVGQHADSHLSRGCQLRAAYRRVARGRSGHGLREVRDGRRSGGHDAYAARGSGSVRERPGARRHPRGRSGQALPRLRPHAGELPGGLLPLAARRQQQVRAVA